MTSRDFCYWLQGFFEIQYNGPVPPEPECRYRINDYQVDLIRKHLNMVFAHDIDPSYGPKPIQDALNSIHNSPGKPGGAPLARC